MLLRWNFANRHLPSPRTGSPYDEVAARGATVESAHPFRDVLCNSRRGSEASPWFEMSRETLLQLRGRLQAIIRQTRLAPVIHRFDHQHQLFRRVGNFRLEGLRALPTGFC
jgi:hypothetical protein